MAGPDHPVEKDRFFEPRLAPQARCDPVARLRHLTRNGGVSRLVRPNETRIRQAKEVEQIQQIQQRDGKQESLGEAKHVVSS